MLFCLKIGSFSNRISKKVTLLRQYLLLFFPEGASVVNICIEAGYAGVGQGKLERWSKFVRDQAIFSIKRVGEAKLCMQLTPHKRMHINASYSNLF